MTGHQSNGACQPTMSDGDTRIGTCGNARRDAGHHLEADIVRNKLERFLAAATEDERIAALQADDVRTGLRKSLGNQQRVDLFLRDMIREALLAHEDLLGFGPRETHDCVRGQVVVNNLVGVCEQFLRTQGQQARVTRTGSHQINHGGAHSLKLVRFVAHSASPMISSRIWRAPLPTKSSTTTCPNPLGSFASPFARASTYFAPSRLATKAHRSMTSPSISA